MLSRVLLSAADRTPAHLRDKALALLNRARELEDGLPTMRSLVEATLQARADLRHAERAVIEMRKMVKSLFLEADRVERQEMRDHLADIRRRKIAKV